VISIRIYWDANILISLFLQDNFSHYARRELQRASELNKETDTILVSHLVILEMIEVLRKRIVEKTEINDTTSYIGWWTNGVEVRGVVPRWRQREIERTVSKITKEATALIQHLEGEGLLSIVDSEETIDSYHSKLYDIFRDTFGTIKINDECDRCKTKTYPIYKLRQIGFLDILHGMTASEFAADEIVTFDSLFPRINHLGSEFNNIYVNVPYFSH